MKIIILAAGMGSRLGNPFPKPLTPLKNGQTIMGRQLNNIQNYFDIDDVTTVVGFKKDLIMERFPEVNYVYNPFFDRTNTSKSLLKALKKNKGKSILWFNGDVVFDEKLSCSRTFKTTALLSPSTRQVLLLKRSNTP
jgi:choline kinase